MRPLDQGSAAGGRSALYFIQARHIIFIFFFLFLLYFFPLIFFLIRGYYTEFFKLSYPLTSLIIFIYLKINIFKDIFLNYYLLIIFDKIFLIMDYSE